MSRNLKGIEFAVIHEHPPVWVIQKRYRRGPAPDDGEYNRLKSECDLTPRSVNPIATYYIMGANVYQSPSIYSVIANRLVRSNNIFKWLLDGDLYFLMLADKFIPRKRSFQRCAKMDGFPSSQRIQLEIIKTDISRANQRLKNITSAYRRLSANGKLLSSTRHFASAREPRVSVADG